METRFKFKKNLLDRLPPHPPMAASSNYELTDTDVTGLKLQVGTTGRKFFWFRYTYRGKKQAIRIGEYGPISIEDARESARQYRAVLDKGGNPQDERSQREAMPLVSDFADSYIAHAQSMGKRTYKNDIAKFRDYILPILGNLRMDAVTVRDIQTLLGSLKGKLSNATINRIHALLSVFFNLAVAWDIIPASPCLKVKKLKENNKVDRFLSADDVRNILRAADQDFSLYPAAAVSALALTGLRREEILKAEVRYFNREERTLFLPHTKSGKTRHVILNDAAFDLIDNLPRVPNSPWIFPGKDPMKPLNNPTKAFQRILKAAGVAKCRLHDLRHGYASMLVNAGASLYQVQQLLGHASHVTTQRYAHVASGTLRTTSNLVTDLINQN